MVLLTVFHKFMVKYGGSAAINVSILNKAPTISTNAGPLSETGIRS